jgi:hypothetical protein
MTTKWIAGLFLAIMSVPGWGQSQDRFALTAQQVEQALQEKGMRTAGMQVTLVANVVATEPNPVFDIRTVEPLGNSVAGENSGTQSWVRVACHEADICLPFYAFVSWPEQAAGSVSESLNTAAAGKKAMVKANAAITIRTGTHAILVMDDSRSHIQIAVISLENGITGHTIRVASPDHKQVYVAEVVSAHLLRRSF